MKLKQLLFGVVVALLLAGCGASNHSSESTSQNSSNHGASSNSSSGFSSSSYSSSSFSSSSSEKTTYTIDFDLNGGSSSSYKGPQVVETLTSDIFFFDCIKEGYNFRGWSYDGTKIFDEKGNQLANPKMAPSMRFVALYANTAKMTITTNMPGAGKISGEGEYNYNTIVTLSVDVNDGYTFLGWCYEDGTLLSKQLSYSFQMWSQDVTIVAKFDYESYTLNVESYNTTLGLVTIKGISTIYLEKQEAKIKYKSSVVIAAYTSTETPFLGWFNDDGALIETNAVYEFVMPCNDYKLVARWDLFRLEIESSDEALGSVNDASGNYSNGEKVNLLATPVEGAEFVGWYMEEALISSSTAYEFPMPSHNASLVAKFKWKSYNVNVYTSETTKGSVSGGGTYEYGSQVTLTATPNGDNTFKGWYIDGESVSNDNPYVFNIGSSDLLIEGKFVGTLYTISFVTNGGDPIDDLVAESGEKISVHPNRTGYSFVGWYTDSSLFLTSYFELGDTMPSFNGTLYAKWSLINYTIIYHLDVRTTNNSANPATYNVISETITLQNPSVSYGTFDGWYTDAEFNHPITQIVKGSTGNLDLYAKATANIYTITFVTNGGSVASPISGAYGDSIALPVPTKANFVFVGWFSDEALENKTNITKMPGENTVLYAKWAEMYKVFEMDSKQYMYFGSYPQSVVSDDNIIDKLKAIAITNDRGYYEYDGSEYAKQTVNAYSSSYIYSDGTPIGDGSIKYFKVEPILWRVLTSDSSGNYMLLASQAINAHRYAESSNNYADSEIRTWINGDFYNSAFKTAEKGAILTTNVDNSASTTNSDTNQYACENTSDKVFLLSYKDYINSIYGFSSSSRKCQPTDYALANYCCKYDGNCYYWTRSPLPGGSNYAWSVSRVGDLYSFSSNVDRSDYAVRPALNVNL